MTPEQYRKMRELFHRLVELPEDEREAALDAIDEHDADSEVRVRLRRLLDFSDTRAIDDDDLRDVAYRVTAPGDPASPVPAPEKRNDESSSLAQIRALRKVLAAEPLERGDALAEGGMGTVYRVRDTALQRSLAMKVMKSDDRPSAVESSNESASLTRRFVDEARITGQLDHPGVVPIHAIGIDDADRVYFTMRLVEGMTFKEVIGLVAGDDEHWTLTRAVNALQRACETVAFAHSRGVVHRDLKPANIMVGAFGETYVMDWGLAKFEGDTETRDLRPQRGATDTVHSPADNSPLHTMDGSVIGTPSYMPPEQARGEVDRLGPPSDVYAMGAILYHLLSGRAPYSTPGRRISAHSMLARVVESSPEPLAALAPRAPAELVAIAEHAMRREPSERYVDMIAMAADLRSFLELRVVRAHRTGPIVEMRKWLQRNRALAATLASLVVIVVVALASIALVTSTKNRQLTDRNMRLAEETDRATKARAAAEARAAEVLRLGDLRNLAFLEKRAQTLWPARPALVADLREWLADADRLADQVAVHRASVERLEAILAGQPPPDGIDETTAPESHPSEEQIRWWLETETRLLTSLERFFADEGGLYPGVQRRMRIATTIEDRTVHDHAEAWKRAADEVRRNPLYGGLELEPVVGLIPLGADPESSLQEFAWWESGALPEAAATEDDDERTRGRWIIGSETALVFVLVPGGEFSMGVPEEALRQPGFEREVMGNAIPAHRVELDPFFIAKYEMTQGQWLRLIGTAPSASPIPGSEWKTLPLDNVSWVTFRDALARLALALPTEAQWEYACRAGTDGAWFPGDDPRALARFANLCDQAFGREATSMFTIESWDDGHGATAPVGSYEPNAFGLHDVHGNVTEWCRDEFLPYTIEPRKGDGRRLEESQDESPIPQRHVIARGGSFYVPASFARSRARHQYSANHQARNLGVRPIVAGWPRRD